MKRILRTVVLVWLFMVPVSASENKGRIEIILIDQSGGETEHLQGKEVRLYDVTDMTVTDNHVSSADILLQDIQGRYQKKSTDYNGAVVFEELEDGLYYVVLTDSQYDVESFLISIPLNVIGEAQYNVIAYPKVSKVTREEEVYPANTADESLSLFFLLSTFISFTVFSYLMIRERNK